MTRKLITNNYYTLIELLSAGKGNIIDDVSTCVEPIEVHNNYLGWLNGNYILEQDKTLTLWNDYILLRYSDQFCVISSLDINFLDHAIDTSEINKVYGKFWKRFESILFGTFERYSKLIDIYTENSTKLMNKLESITKTKSSFNETPQTEVSDPYDTKYSNNTNVSEYTNMTDVGTIMSRIKEIDEGIRNLYNDWANEFDKLFIPNMED